MKYIRLYEERLKDFEIMVGDTKSLIDELRGEIEKYDYDLGYIRDLVTYGHFDIDVFWIDEDGIEWSFLQKASALNKWDIVRVLLEEGGADPNLQDRDGFSALYSASQEGHSQVVQEILKYPSTDPNRKNEDGYTALMMASWRGHSQVVQALLSHPSIDITIRNKYGRTAWDMAKPEIREELPELKPEVR
jgi:hypothetical protein